MPVGCDQIRPGDWRPSAHGETWKAGIDVFNAYLNATRDELLSVAIKKGHLGVVRVLVDLNKDSMHKVTGFGHLPFTSALLLGHLEIARFLVFRGADPEFLGSNRCRRRGAGDKAGKTALSYTAKNGSLESVRFLVEETSSDLEVRGGSTLAGLLFYMQCHTGPWKL